MRESMEVVYQRTAAEQAMKLQDHAVRAEYLIAAVDDVQIVL